MSQGQVWRRSKGLVGFLMAEVIARGPRSVPELVVAAAGIVDVEGRPCWSAKTVENTVRDLTRFGAVEKVRRGRDVMVEVTVLGRAWSAGVVVPRLGESTDDLEVPVEPLSLREVAEELGLG